MVTNESEGAQDEVKQKRVKRAQIEAEGCCESTEKKLLNLLQA